MGSSTHYKPNYFLKDFDTLRTDLITRVPIISDGKLTDLNESSITVTLIELFATMGDMLGFYLDSNALEAFLPTVRQPENVYRHAKTIGYKIRETTSARAEVQFESIRSLKDELTIPAGTRIGTAAGGGVNSQGLFTTDFVATIKEESSLSDIVWCTQGVIHEDTFNTNGTASQRFKLEVTNIDPRTIKVYSGVIEEGPNPNVEKELVGIPLFKSETEKIWRQQESFLYATQDDKVFVAETDYLGVTWVILGDGKYGSIPDAGDQISVQYIQSAGEKGNVNAGAIALVLSKLVNSEGIEIDPDLVVVNNSAASAGGSDRQSLEQVKSNAPGSLSALYRAMTKYDYIALIQRRGGVQHVNVWGEQEEVPNNDNWEEFMNWANVCVAPVSEGGEQPSSNLINDLTDYLLAIQPITVRLRFIPPEYRTFNVGVTISTFSNYHSTTIELQAKNEIADFLDYKNVRFGLDLRASTVYSIVMSIPGVSHVVVDDFVEVTSGIGESAQVTIGQEVVLKKWEIPLLGSINLTMEQAVEQPVPDLYPYPL